MIGLVAAHGGPRRTLEPLGGLWAPEGAGAAWLRGSGITALVRGTSELPAARNPETRLAKAAAKLGIPVYAVEDFPGNWRDEGRHPLAGLFVELEWSRRFHRRRGVKAPIFVSGCPRWTAEPRLARPPRRRPVVLWAGQPDERVCEGTLAVLGPAVAALGGTIVRRRHPRTGSVQPPFAVQARNADLVATAFSSLAVEAGYLGVPALFLLLPGLGADYLQRRTGARTVPWVTARASFGATRADAVPAALRRALDPARREAALARFRRLQASSHGAAGRILDRIRSSDSGKMSVKSPS